MDAQVLEPPAPQGEVRELRGRPGRLAGLGAVALAYRLDFAGEPALADEAPEVLEREIEVLGDLPLPSAMAGEERSDEVALPLAQLALEARGAETGEQHGGAERPARGAQLFRERPPAGADFTQQRAELFRLRRHVRSGRGGGVRGARGRLRRNFDGRRGPCS